MRSQPHDAQAVPAHGSLVISYATKTDHQFDVQFHRSHALAKTGDNGPSAPAAARLARVAKSFRKRWGLGLASTEFNWTLDTGFGLPWKSLCERALPYNLVQQQVTDIAAGPLQQASNRWATRSAIRRSLWPELLCTRAAGFPDLLGRLTYEILTGPDNSNQVPLPNHRGNIAFSLTGTKR